MVCEYDQVLYTKAGELLLNNKKHFRNLVPRLDTFDIIFNLPNITGKRFHVAKLHDVAAATDLITEQSI